LSYRQHNEPKPAYTPWEFSPSPSSLTIALLLGSCHTQHRPRPLSFRLKGTGTRKSIRRVAQTLLALMAQSMLAQLHDGEALAMAKVTDRSQIG